MITTDTLQITIERRSGDVWPVIAEYRPAGFQLASRKEGELRLEEKWQEALLERELDRVAYGRFLGRALFRDSVRDALMHARGQAEERLRLLLVMEDADLKAVHWERLCAPIGPGGKWSLLALDKQLLYSNYLPSLSEKRFPAIGRRDLRALALVANPPEDNGFHLDTFDEEATLAGLTTALGEIPYDILAAGDQAAGPPTLNELAGRLSEERYSLLHIVAHSRYRQDSGETILYLKKEEAGQVEPVPANRLIERLWNVAPLPHLIFLAACESAAPGAEGAGSLGGLAQRLVREIGVPAVVAMTEKVTIATASTLASAFYRQLQESGEVDRALTMANTRLAEADDVTVAALYSRLGSRPLYSDALERPLTHSEIAFGLEELAQLLPERAPVLQQRFNELATVIRGTLESDPEALSKEVRQERQAALEKLDELCLEVIDLSFGALALGQKPRPYDGRNPFRGLYHFRPQDSSFFFGREALVEELLRKVNEHNFLAVLGPSGSGKSSLILAGVVPRLRETQPDLQLAYLTPGADPLAQLRAAHQELNGGPVLTMVDQFEELFTQGADEGTRQKFVEQLLALKNEEPLILTMRADFWGECAAYEELKNEMQVHQELVGPMTAKQLRAAMEQQVAAVGLRFEADLSQTMLDAVMDEPGAMPLLQHALRQLWQRRHGRWLLASEYRAIGGVQKAIAETAEKIYRKQGPEEQKRMREIFIRLTRLDRDDGQLEEVRDTRQRVRLQELVPVGQDPRATHRLVKELADEALLVTSRNLATEQEEVEVAHEAIISHWPRLKKWLHEDRDLLRLRAGIREATREWLDNDKEPGFLFHGARLTAAEEYYESDEAELNEDERAFIEAGIRRRQEQLEERLELERQKTEAERQRAEEAEVATIRQRRLARVALGLLVVALIAAVLAGVFGRQAQSREAEAVSAQATSDHNAAVAATSEANALAEAEQRATAQARADENAVEAEAQALNARTQALISLSTSLLPTNRNPLLAEVERSLLMGAQGLQTSLNLELSVSGRLLDEQARRLLAEVQAHPSQVVLRGHVDSVKSIAFAPDGRWLASGSLDGTVRLWDLTGSGVEPAMLLDHEDQVLSVAFAPDGRWLASGGGDAFGGGDTAIRLWDPSNPESAPVVLEGHEREVNSVAFAPDGRWLASGSDDWTVRLWDLSDLEAKPIELFGFDQVASVAFAPDGRWLAAGNDGWTTRLWDLSNLEAEPVVLRGFGNSVSSVVFARGGEQLVSGSDAALRVWEVGAPQAKPALLEGHEGQVLSVAVAPDGARLASGGIDGTVRLWDLSAPEAEPVVLRGHEHYVNSVTFAPDGRQLASGSTDGTVRLWDLSAPEMEPIVLRGHGDWVRSVAFAPDGDRLASAGGDVFGSGDAAIRLWHLSAEAETVVLEGHTRFVNVVAFAPDGERLASGSSDGTVRLWDPNAPRIEPTVLRGHEGSVYAVAFSLDGRQLASGSFDGTVRLWDLSDLEAEPVVLAGHESSVEVVVYAPDGEQLASGSFDRTVRLWDLSNVEAGPMVFAGHEGSVNAVAFTPDGQWLATGGGDPLGEGDRAIRLWDLSDLEAEPVVLEDHERQIAALAFTPDGRWLASGSADSTVRLWDLSDLEAEPVVLEGHENWITVVAFAPDGLHLASASDDGTVRVWRTLSGFADLFCDLAGRNFTWEEWQQFLVGRPYEKTCSQYPVHCSVPAEAWPEAFTEEQSLCTDGS